MSSWYIEIFSKHYFRLNLISFFLIMLNKSENEIINLNIYSYNRIFSLKFTFLTLLRKYDDEKKKCAYDLHLSPNRKE